MSVETLFHKHLKKASVMLWLQSKSTQLDWQMKKQ